MPNFDAIAISAFETLTTTFGETAIYTPTTDDVPIPFPVSVVRRNPLTLGIDPHYLVLEAKVSDFSILPVKLGRIAISDVDYVIFDVLRPDNLPWLIRIVAEAQNA